jgi:thioredoxin-dependent peroxiredoxin
MTLSIGDQAPEFTASCTNGNIISLSALKGKRVVLYFYPKDDTPGCTKEAQGFSEAKPEFDARNTVILGVSKDDLTSHQKFCEKYDLKIDLLSDTEGTLVNAYGVWVEKSMYGKTFMGIDRATFLIDEKGTLQAIWRKVSVTGHIQKVLQAIDAI